MDRVLPSLAGAHSSPGQTALRGGTLLPPLLLCAVVAWVSRGNFLFGHVLAELFSIVIAITAMIVASTSTHFTRNHFVNFVSIGIGWCAVLDLMHTLSYHGMNLGIGNGAGADTATQFWIAARLLQAGALLAAFAFMRRGTQVRTLHLVLGGIVAALIELILSGRFPTAYAEGQGLTSFKIGAEYLVVLMFAASLVLLRRQRALLPATLVRAMSVALLAMMCSELAFTRYASVVADANLIGHLLKIVAYWCVYVALVQNSLREPFGMLARAASTYDAVPDPTLIVDRSGRIRQANRAASTLTGLAPEALVGSSSHQLFHDPAQSPADCPVCAGLARAGMAPLHGMLLALRDGRTIEYSLAPFDHADSRDGYVEVIRDVSERQRLAGEREALVLKLGQRVRELHCLHTISELAERSDADIPTLLRGIADALPAAFPAPAAVHVRIYSAWGNCGTTTPADLPADGERRSLRIGDTPMGELQVWRDTPEPPAFANEERALLDTVALRCAETIEHLLARAKIRRLSYLYEMLSATNRAVVRCQSEDELLDAIVQAVTTHSNFPMLFIGVRKTPDNPVELVRSHQLPAEQTALLEQALNAPNAPFAPLCAALKGGQVICMPVPPTPLPHSWEAWLQAQDYGERALLPLRREGALYGLVALYTRDRAGFDHDERRLLDEMAEDISFALDNLLAGHRRAEAERSAAASRQLFQEVFRSSPLPMQIFSLADGRLRAQNDAHTRWLGHAEDAAGDLDSWLHLVCPDPAQRDAMHAGWQQAIDQARTSGQAARTAERTLQRLDGSPCVARATMTLVGDDAIVAWTDLTEIRRSERALRESEQRFRGMIEHTVTGVYIRRDHALLYVNPRFCELTGWSASDLLHRDVRSFLPDDARHAEQTLAESWRQLNSGTPSTTITVPFLRGDGAEVLLTLHSTPIVWDDGLPAIIGTAEDTTSRTRTEAQIARYVKQLEGSMKSTLRAVSNMVDLRDPYTAGHERRVGLIAGDIARELGWSPERCESLELIGLVHDIGKIAVPAEILSKPTRLTDLEMQLVRGHAQAGYDILKDVEFAAPVAEVILQHHERIDGSGYPRGLKGDEILPEARVLAVADVLESMAAHRPYRPALGVPVALDELRAGRGTRYDPEAVDAVCRLIETRGYTLPA